MKFGLFGVVSTILDLLWQIVFPLVGYPDYNDLVYKSVKVHEEMKASKTLKEENCELREENFQLEDQHDEK